MMNDLSLHILDITQNSVTAGATHIEIEINEDIKNKRLTISISDNGKGISEEFLARVLDPFTTTRTTRRVGLGLSLLRSVCNLCGGDLKIESTEYVGTKVVASFIHGHIDCPPLGDMAETMITLISSDDRIKYVYTHIIGDNKFIFDTDEVKAVLGEVPVSDIGVLMWIKDYITENLKEII